MFAFYRAYLAAENFFLNAQILSWNILCWSELEGVWRHSGTTKGMFELNRSEGKCGTTDAVFFHWTMGRKCSFEWFLDSDFQILSVWGLHNPTILKWVAFPWGGKGEKKCDPLRFISYRRHVKIQPYLSQFQKSFVYRLMPQTESSKWVLWKEWASLWPPAIVTMKTIDPESTNEM